MYKKVDSCNKIHCSIENNNFHRATYTTPMTTYHFRETCFHILTLIYTQNLPEMLKNLQQKIMLRSAVAAAPPSLSSPAYRVKGCF